MPEPHSPVERPDPGRFGPRPSELLVAPLPYAAGLFAGRRVLVSGAGSGIGLATAVLFARLGADLVICGRQPDKLAAAEQLLSGVGARVLAQPMSIRDPEAVVALHQAVEARFGGLDILVNNAGGQFPQPALDYTEKGWRAVIDTNLTGSWFMMQTAARNWVAAGTPGVIVNVIADIWRGMPQVAHTCAARAGVAYLSKSLAVEWAPHRIRVNCVAPGMIETSGFAVYPPEASAEFANSNPMKRCGTPWEIAQSIAYLAGPMAEFVTGEILTVDGGQQMWGDVWPHHRPDHYKPAEYRSD